MTHTEKLQQIFEAALKDNSEFNKPLTRAFPASLAAKPVAAKRTPSPEPVVEVPAASAAPATSAGQSECESEFAELGKLLEEQQQRKTRKCRSDVLMTLGILTILTGNAFSWFVNSPQRVVALHQAIQDVRSVGDVGSTVAKYQVALDKIAVRSKQIDQATAAMVLSSNQDGATDSTMDTAMLALMGGKDKTTGHGPAVGPDQSNTAWSSQVR